MNSKNSIGFGSFLKFGACKSRENIGLEQVGVELVEKEAKDWK